MNQTSILDEVSSLISTNRVAEAITFAEKAASSGNPNALYILAIWRLIGSPIRRNLPLARTLLRQARLGGHLDAALTEIPLVANGSGADPDWQNAWRLLKDTAKNSLTAADQLKLLSKMTLDGEGYPIHKPQARKISNEPQVWHCSKLLSAAECAHIAHIVADIIEPSIVVDPKTGETKTHPIRTSDGAVVGPTREDLVIGAINRRIASLTGTKFEQGESLSVLRYAKQQQYYPHFDYLPNEQNQRMKTVLVYLNHGYIGGETKFMHSQLKVKAQTGDAIVFDNLNSEGDMDRYAQHAGLPVTQGIKWIATRWIRNSNFDPWME